MLCSNVLTSTRGAIDKKCICMEPCKQWGSICSGGSPLVLGQVEPLGPPVLGSVGRGSTSQIQVRVIIHAEKFARANQIQVRVPGVHCSSGTVVW